MNTTELRIGNITSHGTVYKIEQETDLDFKDQIGCMDHFGGIGVFDSDKVEPILLTEEWLLKFGVKPSEYQDGWLELGSLYISRDKFELGMYDSEYGVGEFRVEIKYIHQLQNLFYCITGKELSCD